MDSLRKSILRTGREKGGAWLCGAAAVGVVLLYNGLFFNRYMPLTEGWFSAYAQQMHGGAVPYRDFDFYLPPLYLWLVSLYARIAGLELIMLRLLGLFVMALFVAGLWAVLRRYFPAWAAAVAAIWATIYYQSGNAHIAYDFIQVMNVAILWALYCLQEWTEGRGRAPWRWAVAAGGLCALAALVKQSNGSLIFAWSWLAAGVGGATRGWREGGRGLGAFALGGGLVVAVCALVLAAQGALGPAIAQMVGGALAAKGDPAVILFAAAKHLVGPGLGEHLLLLAWGLFLGGFWSVLVPILKRSCLRGEAMPEPVWPAVAILVVGGAAVVLPWIRPEMTRAWAAKYAVSVGPDFLIPMGVAGTMLAAGGSLIGWWCRQRERAALVVPALVLVGVIWGNGTSAGYTEAGLFLGCAFFLSMVLSEGGWAGLARWPVVALGLVWLVVWAEIKYARPYHWWGIVEGDVRGDLVSAPHPRQQGMRITPAAAQVYAKVLALLQGEVRPGDRLLVYPHVPVFHVLTGTRPMGRAVVYWFDFLPDAAARAEADILRRDPPPAVLYFELPDQVRDTHERMFRAGRPSGQRDIEETLRAQLQAGVYREKGRVEVSPGHVLRVLVRTPASPAAR